MSSRVSYVLRLLVGGSANPGARQGYVSHSQEKIGIWRIEATLELTPRATAGASEFPGLPAMVRAVLDETPRPALLGAPA